MDWRGFLSLYGSYLATKWKIIENRWRKIGIGCLLFAIEPVLIVTCFVYSTVFLYRGYDERKPKNCGDTYTAIEMAKTDSDLDNVRETSAFQELINLDDTVPTHPTNGECIRGWLVLGPISSSNLEIDFLAEAGGETGIAPQAGDTITTISGETLKWKYYQSKESAINLLQAIGDYDETVAYAFCSLESEIEGIAQVLLGVDNGAKVWINGQQVHTIDSTESLVIDEYSFKANFKDGANHCLVKVSQEDSTWGFAMRAFPLNHSPLSTTPKFFLWADQLKNRNRTITLDANWKYHPGDNPL